MANPSRKSLVIFGLLVWTICFAAVNYVAIKTNKAIDFTRDKQHTLSASTLSLLKETKKEIKVTAFYVGIAPKYLEDILAEYEKQSDGKIKTELVDPMTDLAYAAQFGTVIKGEEQKLIVQAGSERRDVDFTGRTLNQNDINNAIVQVTRKVRQACFLSGHGEADPFGKDETSMSTLAKNLLANNIVSKKFVLGVDTGMLDACDVLIIAGPKADLRPEEELAVKNYLHAGGDAFVMVENVVVTTPDKPLTADQLNKNPSLNGILNDLGLKVNDDVVLDLNSHASGDVGSPATHHYVSFRSIVSDVDYTFYIRPRSISMVSARRQGIKLSPFILTESSEKSWGETNRMLEVKFDEGKDRPGPVPIGFVAFEPKMAGSKSDTRLILITDSDFLTNAYISYYNNALLGLKVINWLTESDYKVFVDEKEIKVDRLTLTSSQKRNVVLILLLIPGLILAAGIAMTFKRS